MVDQKLVEYPGGWLRFRGREIVRVGTHERAATRETAHEERIDEADGVLQNRRVLGLPFWLA